MRRGRWRFALAKTADRAELRFQGSFKQAKDQILGLVVRWVALEYMGSESEWNTCAGLSG